MSKYISFVRLRFFYNCRVKTQNYFKEGNLRWLNKVDRQLTAFEEQNGKN